jgi:hypothetical protein
MEMDGIRHDELHQLLLLGWPQAGSGNETGPGQGAVFIARSEPTNWYYVTAPDVKFSKVELLDTNEAVVVALKGKQLDGDLPQQILL